MYIYENKVNQCMLIAIPDMHWSLEIDSSLNEDDMNEELVIHLFTLLDESTA
ncbi:YueH family protein, partial [Staphylococcus lugdunensis]|uniref:YueH family protein n=1 Tax=Staphylococcus lugdunensis TaxID=28035 RepID=UPI0030C2897B